MQYIILTTNLLPSRLLLSAPELNRISPALRGTRGLYRRSGIPAVALAQAGHPAPKKMSQQMYFFIYNEK